MSSRPQVHHLQHHLLWPLRLLPAASGGRQEPQHAWQRLAALQSHGWQLQDKLAPGQQRFHERHYQEFVTFLPFVQKVLYGEGGEGVQGAGMRVFRREDIAWLRVWLREDQEPLLLDVVHVDLYTFVDVNVVLLNIEFSACDLPLDVVHELLYRLGRAYPSGWDEEDRPLHSLAKAQWLGPLGQVLCESDSAERDQFIEHVRAHRTPRIASHWSHVLAPLLPEHDPQEAALRYRQIEYYRMPVMAYLAVDDPGELSAADFRSLAWISGAPGAQAHATQRLDEAFLQQHADDRYWGPEGRAPQTRYLSCGHALVVVGRADSTYFRCHERGVLAQFRHQHFLLFLLAHFQKAALLMYSDKMVEALAQLDAKDVDSVKRFKRAIRRCFEGFLRYTHRYGFHSVAQQAHARSIHERLKRQLGVAELHEEVHTRIEGMADYLETDSVRRQANTVVKLTVVTIFGLVGTVTTGFLGMNLLAEADASWDRRLWIFLLTFGLTSLLTGYTLVKAKKLSDLLDALSDERLGVREKLQAAWRALR